MHTVIHFVAASELIRMADGSDDEATQLSLTQVEATQVTSIDRDETVVRCLICSLNLTAKSILERELHLNACLDAASLETQYDCPTCGKHLTDYNEQRRMAHVNLCLDRVARFAVEASAPSPKAPVIAEDAGVDDSSASVDSEELYECRICGQKLSLIGLEARSRHVKQCGQRFGLRASDIATGSEATGSLSVEQDEPATQTMDASDNDRTLDQPNAFSVLMAASTSRVSRSTPTAPSNAFEILMKTSRTEAVAQATAPTSSRSFWHTTNAKGPKRMRVATSSTTRPRPGEQRRYGCPDYKCIRGTSPPFVVDGFRYASKSLSNVYFLTHFHSDHYVGLQKSFDCGIIYCNQVTAALTIQELGVDPKFIHPVPMNTPVDIRGVQVTLMDANHCPGAAIILFRLRSGMTYLHTGDFRFHPKMWTYAPLKSFLPSNCAVTGEKTPPVRRIDGVYLDTTYADPKYTFPTQEVSIQHALTLVDKHMRAGDKVLFLFGSYSIGKERLFMEVAQRYERKVCVSKAKLKLIKTYAWSDAQMKLLTTEPAATNLHVVPMQELNLDHLIALQQKHRLRFHQIVAFRPTGWTFSRGNASLSTCQSDPSGTVRIYGIPYSEHSSFAELCDFVHGLNPHSIIPTVNCHTVRSVKKQVDALRQSAFHHIGTMFAPVAASTSVAK